MLLKIVFTMLVIGCVWAVSTKLRGIGSRDQATKGDQNHVKTVKCAECGVYIPKVDAQEVQTDQFLCERHRK